MGAAYANESITIEDDKDDEHPTSQTEMRADVITPTAQEVWNIGLIEYNANVDFALIPNSPNRFDISKGALPLSSEGDPQLLRIH